MKLIVLICFLVSYTQFIWAQNNILCRPSLQQTSLVITSSDSQVKIHITNPMGYEFMPQLSGPISAFVAKTFQSQIDDLKPLGQQFAFVWDKSKCQINEKSLIAECHGLGQNKIEGISANTLMTAEIIEKKQSDVFEKIKYTLAVEKEGNTYFLNFEFPKSGCKNFN